MARHRLSKMKLGEISLVDEPNDHEALIDFIKVRESGFRSSPGRMVDIAKYVGSASDEGKAVSFDEALVRIDVAAKTRRLWDLQDALGTAIRSTLSDEQVKDKVKAIRGAIQAFSDEAESLATELVKANSETGATPVEKAANQVVAGMFEDTFMDIAAMQAALAAAEAQQTVLKARAETAEEAVTVEKARADKAEADLAAANEVISKAKPQLSADEEDAEFLKGLPERARAEILKARELTAAAAVAADEAEQSATIEKAKGFKFGDPALTGPLLHRIAKGKTTPEDAAAVERLFAAAGAQGVTTELFKVAGKTAAETDQASDDPDVILKAKAVEIQKANPGMSDAVAYDRATQELPGVAHAAIEKSRGRKAAA